ncbi:MAG: hypothetical protein IAE78_07570 [Myxococcus sp.]|nr:hypothetical protein [Myxococcus sp.]
MPTRSDWMAAVGVMALLVGCESRTVRMSGSADVPAAEGTVRVSAGANGNTLLDIEVLHLALPERATAGATTFVVWALPLGETTPQNVGALRVDHDLRGTLKTLTPLRGLEVFITAEPEPMRASPSGPRLLTARIPPES